MAIDRAATLRNAEKLFRQGKLDAAIAEYQRVVAEYPRDWNTANILGDLYHRVGQLDAAIEQFLRIGDSLCQEGFLPKGAALYKKALKLRPDDEAVLLRAAEAAVAQGLMADARAAFNAVAERRRSRGDRAGAAEIRVRLGGLDPADLEARANAARARAELGDVGTALRELKDVAAELTDKGRTRDALTVLLEAQAVDAGDEGVRDRLVSLHLSTGDVAAARDTAGTAEQWTAVADAYEARGERPETIAALREAVLRVPGHAALTGRLVRLLVAQGDLAAASEFATTESVGDDAETILGLATGHVRAGRVSQAVEMLAGLMQRDAELRDRVTMVGWEVAREQPEAGFRIVELAADVSVACSDWGSAAAAIQEFVTRVPNYIPALLRLVEICVDGGLESTMYAAQALLADAYLDGGFAAEARFIAEDLVAHEPWDTANIERFRRTLMMLGEPDPDAIIEERLSGQSPFSTTDMSLGDLPPLDRPPAPAEEPAGAWDEGEATVSFDEEPEWSEPMPTTPGHGGLATHAEASIVAEPAPGRSGAPAAPSGTGTEPDGQGAFDLAGSTIDLTDLLAELQAVPLPMPDASGGRGATTGAVGQAAPLAHGGGESAARPASPSAEVAVPTPTESAAGVVVPASLEGEHIEDVFEALRGEAAAQWAMAEADENYAKGIALRDEGYVEESLEALQAASRAPKYRFLAAQAIGRIYRSHGMLPQTIEWFERAVLAPAPTPGEAMQLMYELADALEADGETVRALAVCLELQAETGDYRDVAERVERLSRVAS